MTWKNLTASVVAAGLLAGALYAATSHKSVQVLLGDLPRYDSAGRLLVPQDYREWVFLSAGLDMRYAKGTPPPTDHVFNNVFAPPAAYRAFKATGT